MFGLVLLRGLRSSVERITLPRRILMFHLVDESLEAYMRAEGPLAPNELYRILHGDRSGVLH